MDDIIRKIDITTDKKFGKILLKIVISAVVLILILYFLVSVKEKRDGISKIKNAGITITTSDWTVVPVAKKDFSFSVVEVGNLKPKYTVSINGDKNRMYELPGNKIPHLGYGVTNIWFILKEGQGITSAKIILEEEN